MGVVERSVVLDVLGQSGEVVQRDDRVILAHAMGSQFSPLLLNKEERECHE